MTRATRGAARAGDPDRASDKTGGMFFDKTYGKSEKANHNWVRNDVRKLDETGGRNRGRVEKNWMDGKNGDGAEKLEGHFCTRMTTIIQEPLSEFRSVCKAVDMYLRT